MKKHLLLLCAIILTEMISAQIICIQCFSQNSAISPNATNLVVNGSFETGTCTPGMIFCSSSDGYQCDFNAWTCDGGGPYTYAQIYTSDLTTVPQGFTAAYLGNSFAYFCSDVSNDNSCLLFQDCEVSGIPQGYPFNVVDYGGNDGVRLRQTINNLVPGEIYALEFWTGGEDFDSFPENGVFGLDIGFGNKYLQCIPTSSGDIGLRYVVEFIATETSHIIQFTNWGHACDACTELIVDDVRLYQADELPSSFPACEELVQNNDLKSLAIFPNPSKDEVTFQSYSFESGTLSLFDLSSRLLIKQSFIGQKTIQIGALETGIYLYVLETTNGTVHTGKLIKE